MPSHALQTVTSFSGKKPLVVLHIGMHKTGSTSLQRFFMLNRLGLQLCGIDYPKAQNAQGRRLSKHNDLFHAISHEKDFNQTHPVFGPSAARVQAFTKLLRPGRVLLLSAEGFSGESPAFARAFAPLQEHADVRVVCFLRRQDDWIESFYKQMVMSREVHETLRLEGFLEHPSTHEHLNYLQILDWWAEVFGVPAIKVVIFPPRQGLLSSFLQAAGLPPALRFLPFGNNRQNQSQRSGYIERVRLANAAGLPLPEPDPADTNEPFFAPEARQAFLQSYEAINEAIRTRYRPDLRQLFD